MNVNIDLSKDELMIVIKALSDMYYDIYCGKAPKNYAEKEKQIDALFEKFVGVYNGWEVENDNCVSAKSL